MRAKHFWIGLASTASVACAVVAGCGGSSSDDSSNNPPDAGADATHDATADTNVLHDSASPDTAEAACVPDANIQSFPVPDASLGDSGATAQECVSCVQSACPSVVSACNESCQCVGAFEAFETCIAGGDSILDCAEADLGSSGIQLTDLTCAIACETPCGYGGGGGDGGDSGSNDAGDAAD